MKMWSLAILTTLVVCSCSAEKISLSKIVQDSVRVEILDHGPNPEPSVWGKYTMSIPTWDADGEPFASEVALNFYVDELFLDDHSTSLKRGPVGSSQPPEERQGEVKTVRGMSRLPLHVVAAPGKTGKVRFEIVYSVKNTKTGELLISGTNSTTKIAQRQETQQ